MVASPTDAVRDSRSTLADAEALATQGRRLEAIELLSELNRNCRDPEVERRLVMLRHEAFDQMASEEVGREAWPPEFADPFDGAPGPHEIQRGDLSSEVLGGAIVNHGSLVVRELISVEKASELRNGIERAFRAREAHESGTGTSDDAEWFLPFEKGRGTTDVFGREAAVRAVDSPRLLFEVITLYQQTGAIAAIQGYLAERPGLSVNKFVLRKCPTGVFGKSNFHQDGAFLGDGIRTVNLWLSLSECGVDAPSLDIVPRRLPGIVPTGGDQAAFSWTVTPERAAEVARDTPIVRLSFSPGDAIFFDELLLHRTGVSAEMTQPRYAIESWFFAPSCYPPRQIPIVV